MRYLGCVTLGGEGAAKGGATGPAERRVGWGGLQGMSGKLPSSQLWRNGTPSTVSDSPTSRESNPLPLPGLTFKGLKQLAQDFPITQVTWVTPPCLETWKIKSQTISQFLSLAECIPLSPPLPPPAPQQGSTTLWVKSAGGGGTMQVARCREELRRVSGARGWVARRGPLPSVPPLGSGCSGFAWRPVPQRVGGGGKKW